MKRAITWGIGALALAVTTLPTSAADLGARPITKAPIAAPVALYNWSGFYIGGHVGGLWADKDWTDVTPPPPFIPLGSHTASGVAAGGQVGFNWQTGAWVFGVEGQFSWTNADSDHGCIVAGAVVLLTCRTEMNWVGTAAGRIGYAFNNVLLYAKGGAAFADEDFLTIPSTTGVALGVQSVALRASDTRTGWMVGGGVEWGFTPNWSAKIEYNFMEFGKDTFAFVDPVFGTSLIQIDQQVHLVKAGINYRFTWGP